MAKVKIQGNASGTGILTVTAPNTSTDRTITLPDGDVTLGAATPSIDDNGNATAITIDSDENVLIGKTTYVGGSAVTGIDIRPVGMVNIAREGDTLMYMNRKTSDGDILEFRKDGASIGSIGVDGGDNLYITGESGNTGGIYINDAAVSPAYQGAERDDYYSLGKAPARWKDLYLSGGLKVGGTAAANTLDDYEEGTCTIQYSDGSTTVGDSNLSKYTKVGRLVTVTGYLNVTNIDSLSNGLAIRLTGFPFTNTTDTAFPYFTRFWDMPTGTINTVGYLPLGQTFCTFYAMKDNASYQAITCGDVGNSNDLYFGVSYHAS